MVFNALKFLLNFFHMQAWLEKNQEKFGDKHVKFGYVVYTDREVAARLLRLGYVAVGRAKVGVKPMDGQPAAFAF